MSTNRSWNIARSRPGECWAHIVPKQIQQVVANVVGLYVCLGGQVLKSRLQWKELMPLMMGSDTSVGWTNLLHVLADETTTVT